MIDTSWMVLSLYATKNSPQIVSFTDRRYLCLHINRCKCKGPHTFHSVCVVCASTSGVAGDGTDSTVRKPVCVSRCKPNLVNALLLKTRKKDIIY